MTLNSIFVPGTSSSGSASNTDVIATASASSRARAFASHTVIRWHGVQPACCGS
jgi:hypothetical protein